MSNTVDFTASIPPKFIGNDDTNVPMSRAMINPYPRVQRRKLFKVTFSPGYETEPPVGPMYFLATHYHTDRYAVHFMDNEEQVGAAAGYLTITVEQQEPIT